MPSRWRQNCRNRAVVLSSLAVSAMPCAIGMAQGVDAVPEKPANKLTLGFYQFAETRNAADINLRHNNEYGDTWLGYYHSAGSGDEVLGDQIADVMRHAARHGPRNTCGLSQHPR